MSVSTTFLHLLETVPNGASDDAVKASATQTLLRLLDGDLVDVNETDAFSRTPLHRACAKGLETVALRLLDTGEVDVDAKDAKDGTTPLFWACNSGLETVALRLLDTGVVDVDAKDTRNHPILDAVGESISSTTARRWCFTPLRGRRSSS